MRVLLSIKPEFASKILNGEKRFEYRKRIFKHDVTEVVLYASSPLKRLVGEFRVGKIICDNPESLWRATSSEGGVSSEQFFDYFEGCELGYALTVEDVARYDKPLDPRDTFDGFRAPQSFTYIA